MKDMPYVGENQSGFIAGRDAAQLALGGTNIGRDLVATFALLGAQEAAAALHQLPAEISDFTGRDAELTNVLNALKENETRSKSYLLAIAGKPGVGKSALAIRLAHKVSSQFPDGQLYINLRGAEQEPLDPADVLEQFLRALGVPIQLIPTAKAEREVRYRSVLSSRRMLLVLDNAVDERQVRPLLPSGDLCATIVTSRALLVALEGAQFLPLQVLDAPLSVELLGAVAGKDRIASEDEAAQEIAQLCGHLPLALRIAAAKLNSRPNWPLSKLADRLRLALERGQLNEFAAGDLEIWASFNLSYQGLKELDKKVFRLAGLLPPKSFSVDAVVAATGNKLFEVELALQRLVDAQLIEEASEDRYRFHDLLRVFAKAKVSSRNEWERARERYWDWYLRNLYDVGYYIAPKDIQQTRLQPKQFSNFQEGLDWLETEREALILVAEEICRDGEIKLAWVYANQLAYAFELRSYWTDSKHISESVLSRLQQTDDPEGRAITLNDLGKVYYHLGQWNEALQAFRESLKSLEQKAIPKTQAEVYDGLGALFLDQGRYDDAMTYFSKSLELNRREKNRRYEGSSLNNMGFVRERQGRWEEARTYFQEALAIAREVSDDANSAVVQVGIGLTYSGENQWEKAISCFEPSLEVFHALRDRHREAQAHHHLGVARVGMGLLEDAIAHFELSLATFDALGDPYRRARVSFDLGRALVRVGRNEEARHQWSKALDLFRELSAPEALEVESYLTPS